MAAKAEPINAPRADGTSRARRETRVRSAVVPDGREKQRKRQTKLETERRRLDRKSGQVHTSTCESVSFNVSRMLDLNLLAFFSRIK